MTEAKRRIHKFKFDSEGAHVALVDKAANAQEVLVMKSQTASDEEIKKAVEVNIKTTLLEFLTRYLYLSIDEAEMVAGMLGMTFDDLYEQEDIESFEDMVQTNLDKVKIAKSAVSTKFVESFSNFQEKFSTKSSSSVEGGGTASKSTEETQINKEESTMTQETQVTNDDVQAMIKKALADQEAEIRKSVTEELTKSFEEKDQARAAELEVLKAKEDAREERAFIAKAAEFKEHLTSEETEQAEAVQALAKALRKASADEDMKPLVDLAKSLQSTIEKSALLEEAGATTVEKDAGVYDTEGDKLVMKMAKEEGISEDKAYAKLLIERPELFS